jgi:hypothetical protein
MPRKEALGNPMLAAMAMQQASARRAETPAVRQENHLRNTAIAVAGVALGGGLLFLVGREVYRSLAEEAALNRTDDEARPENFAQRLYNAFFPGTPFGIGTDEVLVRDTIRAVPHRKFWEDVKSGYKRLSRGRSLMEDMAGELSVQMKREIDLILSMLPDNARDAANRDPMAVSTAQLEAWAERLKQAADYEASWAWPYGTDEEAIYAVLEELPLARFACDLDRVYRRMHGHGLLQMLVEEMEGEELNKAYRIILNKPDAKGKTLTEALRLCQAR